MVRVRYVGLGSSPETEFETLRPFRDRILQMQHKMKPFGPDYLVLEALKEHLETAAFHFTRDPTFFTRGNLGHSA